VCVCVKGGRGEMCCSYISIKTCSVARHKQFHDKAEVNILPHCNAADWFLLYRTEFVFTDDTLPNPRTVCTGV